MRNWEGSLRRVKDSLNKKYFILAILPNLMNCDDVRIDHLQNIFMSTEDDKILNAQPLDSIRQRFIIRMAVEFCSQAIGKKS